MRPEILIALVIVSVLARVRPRGGWFVSPESDDSSACERRLRRSECARLAHPFRAPLYR